MPDNKHKSKVFNPDEHRIHMRKIRGTAGGDEYYIGNVKMSVNLKGTVVKFYLPRDAEDDHGLIVINRDKRLDEEYDDYEDDE